MGLLNDPDCTCQACGVWFHYRLDERGIEIPGGQWRFAYLTNCQIPNTPGEFQTADSGFPQSNIDALNAAAGSGGLSAWQSANYLYRNALTKFSDLQGTADDFDVGCYDQTDFSAGNTIRFFPCDPTVDTLDTDCTTCIPLAFTIMVPPPPTGCPTGTARDSSGNCVAYDPPLPFGPAPPLAELDALNPTKRGAPRPYSMTCNCGGAGESVEISLEEAMSFEPFPAFGSPTAPMGGTPPQGLFRGKALNLPGARGANRALARALRVPVGSGGRNSVGAPGSPTDSVGSQFSRRSDQSGLYNYSLNTGSRRGDVLRPGAIWRAPGHGGDVPGVHPGIQLGLEPKQLPARHGDRQQRELRDVQHRGLKVHEAPRATSPALSARGTRMPDHLAGMLRADHAIEGIHETNKLPAHPLSARH